MTTPGHCWNSTPETSWHPDTMQFSTQTQAQSNGRIAPLTWVVQAVVMVERALGTLATAAAAGLIVIESALLFTGVMARYVFEVPIVWIHGLSDLLFLWLSGLGAVVALRRSEHMRLTGFLQPKNEVIRHRIDLAILSLITVTAILLLSPAIDYVRMQAFITNPSLGISDAWRVLALPVSLALFVLYGVSHILNTASWRDALWTLLPVALGFLLIHYGGSQLEFLGKWNLVLYFLVLLPLFVLIGTPIAFAFLLPTLFFMANIGHIPASIVVGRMGAGMSDAVLLAVPLFVFLGALIEITGIARALVDFLLSIVGHLRGGVSYVLIIGMYLVSGISGSKAADMAAISPILRPASDERDEEPAEFVALMSTAGAMSETIPPSLVLIIVGSVTTVSISALFTAGLLPAAIGALALGIFCAWRARKRTVKVSEAATARQRGKAFVIAVPALVLPLVIRAAVVEGVATATEVATIGVVYSAIVGIVIYRKFQWRRLYPALVETASLSGAIMLIIGCATAMSWALTQSGVSSTLAAAMAAVPGGHFGFLLVSIVFFVVVGSFLEGIPAMVLFAPLLFPIAQGLGVNTVHYAIVAVLSMGVGLFAPPFGVGFYASCVIGDAPPDKVMKRIWPYLAVLLLSVLLVAAVPWLTLGFL